MSLNRKNIMLLAVILSVTLNLFFVGALAARYMDRPQRPSEPPSVRWVMRDLDPVTRESMRPQMGMFGDSLRPLRGEMFRAQNQVNELLAAETLDQQAVEQAFRRLREANLRYQELSHQQLAQVMAQLSSEQRTRAMRFMSERRSPDSDRNGGRNADRNGERNRDGTRAPETNHNHEDSVN
jgi:uncharacterized membrane protein